MPWSAGAFARVGGSTHWVDDKNASINIVASRHDTNDEDLAAGISFCLNRDGTSKPTGDFLPAADATQNLGNGSFRWASITAGVATAPVIVATTSVTTGNINATAFKSTPTAVQGLGPISGSFLDMTPDFGFFVGAITGCTAGVNVTCNWIRSGKFVLLNIGTNSGTSNSTSMTMTGLPAAIQPASLSQQDVPITGLLDNNLSIATTTSSQSARLTSSSGTITFLRAGIAAGFTAANAKGITNPATIFYSLI